MLDKLTHYFLIVTYIMLRLVRQLHRDARAWYMLDGQDSSTLSRTVQLQVKNKRPG